MRDIQYIQKDISHVINMKENFFTKYLDTKAKKLAELRKEEFECLDKILLEKNIEYKNIARSIIELFDNLVWEFKTVDTTTGGGSVPFQTLTPLLKGQINNNGHIYCERQQAFKMFQKHPVKSIGTIDHYGNISILANDLDTYEFSHGKTFIATIVGNGEFTFDKETTVKSERISSQIETISGDPFLGHEDKRKTFLMLRNKLFAIINQNRT